MTKTVVVKNMKLLGAFVSQAICDYMALYIKATKTTKSKLLRQIVKDWFVSTSEKFPAYELQLMIVTDIQASWYSVKTTLPEGADIDVAFNEFRTQEANSLQKQGLSFNSIKQIITLIKV